MTQPDSFIRAEVGLLDLFKESASAHPERCALSADGRRFTYRQLDEWSDTIGGAAPRRGSTGR